MASKKKLPADVLIRGDNLDVIDALPDGIVDLCYIDPPFLTGKKRKGAKLGLGQGGRRRGAGPEHGMSWDDCRGKSPEEYMEWLRPRLAGIVRLLKPAASLLVHLDFRMSHYVKVELDRIAGRERFVNEIVWHYASGGARSARRLARKHDVILWYAMGAGYAYHPEAAALPRGSCRLCGQEAPEKNHLKRERDADGRTLRSIRSGGRVYVYYDDAPAPPCDVWLDISHLQQRDPERTGYPTQKPLALLERLVLICSDPGDLVADFFMGSGTALVAAAANGRHWLGCDVSDEALAVARERLAAIAAIGAEGAECQ